MPFRCRGARPRAGAPGGRLAVGGRRWGSDPDRRRRQHQGEAARDDQPSRPARGSRTLGDGDSAGRVGVGSPEDGEALERAREAGLVAPLDHTEGVVVKLASCVLGARVVERGDELGELLFGDPAQLALDYRTQQASKSAGYGCPGVCVCDTSGDTKLDLRTCISLTPNMELTRKALAALAHAGKSPVAGPLTTCEDLRINTYPIIAHANSEIGIAKSDFGLNMAGLCMLIRVAERFACDAISLVTNDGSQLAGLALHDYAILRL